MEEINWSYFPEPYNRELPFYVGKALEGLSPEGIELLDVALSMLARVTHHQEPEPPDEADLEKRLAGLPEWDFTVVVAINKHIKKAFDAVDEALAAFEEQTRGERDLLRQLNAVVSRARELDSEFAARGEEVTVGEAVAVLKRHGARAGISDEVLDMVIAVPPEEE